MSDTIPVLFDTDIGSDIDDAVALAYLVRQPRCELVGVTTVTGDTAKRAALCEIVLRAGGRADIPIIPGLSGPLLHGPGQPQVPQYEAVKYLPHGNYLSNSGDAVDFLRTQILRRPHELTLLAVGPMTNIAALFALDPEIASYLKKIVLMCGFYQNNEPQGRSDEREWNALVDPVAAGIVYKYGVQTEFLTVGTNVTMQCQLPAPICRERFTKAGGALGVVGQMAEVWFHHTPNLTFHDPLAAALLFAPDVCGYERGHAVPVTDAVKEAGFIRWTQDEAGQHITASAVRPDAFFAEYFGVTGG